MIRGEEDLSKNENIENDGLVRENVERVAEILNNEMKSKNEKGELLNTGDELQKEFKNEIEKIKLGMLQIVKQLQNVEKVIEVDKVEMRERIEVETEIKKLKEPRGREKKKILKRIKQEKDREKLSIEGKVMEQEAIERKKLLKKLRKKIKERLEKLQCWMEERQGMVEKSKEQEQSVERRKVGGKLTEQEESMERFEKVFDDIEIEDAKIERRGDKMGKGR